MGFCAVPDMTSPPFACPPDIVLDLPAPLSVNRTRRIDWASKRRLAQWQRSADYAYLLKKQELNLRPITGRFEIIITLRDGSRIDADNTAKHVIDALRRFRLIPDDNPKHMRRVTIEFGDVEGCRATVRPIE